MPNPDHPYYLLSKVCRQYHATLVVVSKTRTKEEIDGIYQMGQRIFAENRAQDLLDKAAIMPTDIEWHLIGHLQTNKVKLILPQVKCIQSMDSERLWQKINEEAIKTRQKINCLLQIKIASEETKYGWSFDELDKLLTSGKHKAFPNVVLCGVMGMASLTSDMEQVRGEMRQLKTYFDYFKENFFLSDPSFRTISMGMSGDYKIALEEGSTMVRIGSLLFE